VNISFVIPTCGRKSIVHAVESLRSQTIDGDEIIVVHDPGTTMPSLKNYGLPLKVICDNTPGNPKWGYKARTHGMSRATCPWIHIIGDDDVYLPGSIAKLRPLLQEKTPIICKMKRRYNENDTIWRIPQFSPDNQGGEMYVFPNIPEKMGRFDSSRYDGDGLFISELVEKHGKVRWSEIEICRWRAYD